MMLILELCFRFFCCGLFAIGGGLATLPVPLQYFQGDGMVYL